MTDSEYLRSELLEGMGYVQSTWKKTLPAGDAAIDGLPGWCPGFVKSKLHDEWHDSFNKVDEQLEQLRCRFKAAGRAYPLKTAADQWRLYIAGHVSEQPGVVSSGKLLSDDYFRGMTADAYRSSVIPTQGDAMTAVAENLARPLAQVLDDAAGEIDNYTGAGIHIVIDLGAAVASFLVGLATSESGLGTPVFWTAALVAVADACYQAMDADHDLAARMKVLQGNMQGMLTDWSGFEDHAWPKAVFPT